MTLPPSGQTSAVRITGERSYCWRWKRCAAAGKVTRGSMHGLVAAIRLLFLGPIGMAIVQAQFNKVA